MPPQAIMPVGYCERASQAFWAEPMNALSNGAFILAAIAGLLLCQRSRRRDWPAAALIALVLMIGIGSFLFHTMPQRWTLLADVLPIQFFAFSYFGLALVRFMRVRPAVAVGGILAFVLASVLLEAGLGALLPPGMRGSAGYVSFVLALFGVAFAVRRRNGGDPAAGLIGLAGLVFALSLTLRTLDLVLCQAVPSGTHWLWHLLNALVLYLLLRAAIERPSASL
ncbi:Ceramidase [Bosea sp. LC85]|uniref:ceramidase domain-containing protein n=1 Tax=Bosea sp. LC85 TaxID=1502851 RepID=UPI0004E3BB77|nr:ceramidase domain-containing protein [Bosea sp. LC85]KFC74376.1 Ceramidase [Bosea sp. LC85]